MSLLTDIASVIQNMTNAVHRPSPAPAKTAEAGWWVLICGEALNPEDFDQRERARTALREVLTKHGIKLNEFVWIWDETETAQVVAGHHRHLYDAREQAQKLTQLGLTTRIIARMQDED